MKRAFKKELAALEAVFEFIDKFVTQHDIDEAAAFSVSFAIEEIFTNMVKYSARNEHAVLISLNVSGRDLIISLTEYDVDEFDVTAVAGVDTELSLEERKIGGLGLHLTKKVMDNIAYTYSDGNSTITLTKYLER